MKKLTTLLISVLATSCLMTSCLNSSNPVNEESMFSMDFTLNPEYYTPDGYWAEVYNPEQTYFILYPGVFFSHNAQVDVYDGVEYKSFTGFCPTKVNDQTDHTGSDWTLYQFSAIAPSNTGYMIAHWDVRETAATPVSERSCWIDFAGATVRPAAITVTNTDYAYWVMKNGSAFSKPFTGNDYLVLNIYGVNKGVVTQAPSVYLARNGEIVDTWQNIDLTSLGEVQYMYFTMESSDSGEWGMNTPAYFALGGLAAAYINN